MQLCILLLFNGLHCKIYSTEVVDDHKPIQSEKKLFSVWRPDAIGAYAIVGQSCFTRNVGVNLRLWEKYILRVKTGV